MTTDITELAPAMKAAAELITSGYSRKWIVSHDDETCWVGANDDDGNLTPFIEVSITDWSGNKADNETLARFIALCRPANVLALVEALEKAQSAATQQGNIACALFDEVTQLRRNADEKAPELRAQLIEADSELEALRQRIAELEFIRTAYMEWSDKTDWVQTDKRFDVLKPWGKHRADVLREYIEHLESRTVEVLTPEMRNALKAEGLADVLKDASEYAPLTAGQWETLTKNWHQTFIGLSGSAAGIKVETE
ncbi:ead/Ea22-like family protein [Klebsiella michiganensis]